MIDLETLDRAVEHIRAAWPEARPRCGLVLGSGWGDVVEGFADRHALPYEEIPGLGRTGVAGHSGRLVRGVASGIETLIFQGRRHWYEGVGWTPIALPIYVLQRLGAEAVVLTNAAGGLRADLRPGRLMALTDHINLIGANPLQGPHQPVWGARFPDQSEVYDVTLRRLLHNAARGLGEDLAEGVYLAAAGPLYETPAEIRAYRTLGADAVGMSTVPEAQLARAAGLRVAGLSCITNLAAGIGAEPLSHEEVTATTRLAMGRMKGLILRLWQEMELEGLFA